MEITTYQQKCLLISSQLVMWLLTTNRHTVYISYSTFASFIFILHPSLFVALQVWHLGLRADSLASWINLLSSAKKNYKQNTEMRKKEEIEEFLHHFFSALLQCSGRGSGHSRLQLRFMLVFDRKQNSVKQLSFH